MSQLPPGRIDVHSHLLPGIDDGCQSLEESLTCVGMLRAAGYVGSICTPHVWPEMFPGNTPDEIARRVDLLRGELANRGIDYHLWAGGELRIFEGVTAWMEQHGVPALAHSNAVLMDFWDPFWPDALDETVDWLLTRNYQPILAHPERTVTEDNFDRHLRELQRKGVLLQGNFRCFTGRDGNLADQVVRQLMRGGDYALLALDMHRPKNLDERLNGIPLAQHAFGEDTIESLIRDAPRRLLLSS